MSFFGVTKEVIETVKDCPNSDNLSIATLKDMLFQFVVRRGVWKEGDKCLYFPVDSLLPAELMLALGVAEKSPETGEIVGKLSGGGRNRVKTIRLRGQISQGIVAPILPLLEGLEKQGNNPPEVITEFLGVTKYDPEISAPGLRLPPNGLKPLPAGFRVYDLEGADRNKRALEELLDLPVVVMEKLEGMNCCIGSRLDGEGRQEPFALQRRYEINLGSEPAHPIVETARRMGAFEKVELIRRELGALYVAVYGEFIGVGVQKNIYKLAGNDIKFFDIFYLPRDESSPRFASYEGLRRLLAENHLGMAPLVGFPESMILLREVLEGRSIQDFSTAPSQLYAPQLREGIVIRPREERFSQNLQGRLILKQRSPEYLAKGDA